MRKREIKPEVYSPEEERANALTHGIGIVGGLAGLLMVWYKVPPADTARFWSCSIFCFTCIILYGVSTLYHSVKARKQKILFKQLDHISIYLLIAGTFTPFAWGVLGNEALGRHMLGAAWAIAIAGIIFKVFFTGRYEAVSLVSYLGMGWLGYLMFGRVAELLGREAVDLLLYGGICYTAGVGFYLLRRLKYHHAIWHLFVLAGTGFHLSVVMIYVVR